MLEYDVVTKSNNIGTYRRGFQPDLLRDGKKNGWTGIHLLPYLAKRRGS